MTFKKDQNTVLNIDEHNCFTELDLCTYKVNWTIKEFELICKSLKFIESEKFPAKVKGNDQWCLRMELTELDKNNSTFFKFTFKKGNAHKRKIYTKISVFNSFNDVINFKSAFPSYDTEIKFTISASALHNKLLSDNLLPKDITIVFEVTTFNEIRYDSPQTLFSPIDDFMDRIGGCLDNEAFKDVTFHVDEEEYTAHKLILSFRSPVFAAMFKSNMSEKLTSAVEIKDMSAKVFRKMLRAIYTDKVDNLNESAVELYYAAEKYQLDHLKAMCINSLYENLSCKNVIKTLELADIFSISKLKDESIKCLSLHLSMLSESKEFVELIEIRPNLVVDILKSVKSADKMHLRVSNKQDDDEC